MIKLQNDLFILWMTQIKKWVNIGFSCLSTLSLKHTQSCTQVHNLVTNTWHSKDVHCLVFFLFVFSLNEDLTAWKHPASRANRRCCQCLSYQRRSQVFHILLFILPIIYLFIFYISTIERKIKQNIRTLGNILVPHLLSWRFSFPIFFW